ncbi:MAG: hypothetical protein KF858_01380 [Candidatus Sumerlaeia bacterium]|nr:hypothetical protein [Candidatus Sumerlaeia bacterium]
MKNCSKLPARASVAAMLLMLTAFQVVLAQSPTTGTLDVSIAPPLAVDDGAQWSVDGGATWHESASPVVLPTGFYNVDFLEIADWLRPLAGAPHGWVWSKGSNVVGAAGVYGTRGDPDEANTPGARTGSRGSVGADGELWLFGGITAPVVGESFMDDLWRFEPETGNWTWIKGSDTANPSAVYGTLGEPDIANTPGGRTRGLSWTDHQGRFWYFGGLVGSQLSNRRQDLWRFDPSTNAWTWMKGSSVDNAPSVFGDQGVSHPSNTPGARVDAAGWVDLAGSLWVFGGYGRSPVTDDVGSRYLNDLWRYDTSSGDWTWRKGTAEANHPGHTGTRGIPDPDNIPAARHSASTWLDSDGNLWLFGGLVIGPGLLDDLWRFDPATNTWTWMAGNPAVPQNAAYGELGVPAAANTPGARMNAATFTDSSGGLWLFGGARDANRFSDLWRYDIPTGNWAWMAGPDLPNQSGTYGNQGEPAENNSPGARQFACSWTGADGKFWLFGGQGSGGSANRHNDLWSFHPGGFTNRVLVQPNHITAVTGTYTPTGALEVSLEPLAIAGVARWSHDGKYWRESTETIILPEGTYNIQFDEVAGRTAPPVATADIVHRLTTRLTVYYNSPPQITHLTIEPATPRTLDDVTAVFETLDADLDSISDVEVEWLLDGQVIAAGETLAASHTAFNQAWEVRARARDDRGDWGAWATHSFTIANTPPTQPIVEVRPPNPAPGRDLVADIVEYSVDADGDTIAYDFHWFVSRDRGQTWIHKVELNGSPQVSNEFIFPLDVWRVHVIPYEVHASKTGAPHKGDRQEGEPGWHQVYVGQNHHPDFVFTRIQFSREASNQAVFDVAWEWHDPDGDAATMLLFWTDRGPRGLHSLAGPVPASAGALVVSANIPADVSTIYLHGILIDEKGAMSQRTAGLLTGDASGSLHVVLGPPPVTHLGAAWRRVGSDTWNPSDHVELAVPVGIHQVEFQPVLGWVAPATREVLVAEGSLTEIDEDYISLSIGPDVVRHLCVDDFGGWIRQSIHSFPDVSEPLTPAATTFKGRWPADLAPVITPIPTAQMASSAFPGLMVPVTTPSTDSLSLLVHASPGNTGTTNANLAPQFASWQSIRRDILPARTTVPVEPDRVYVIRWTVSVQEHTQSALAPQVPDVRFRVGDPTNMGHGQAMDILSAPGANAIVGPGLHVHRSYYYAPPGTPPGSEIGFAIDLFDFFQDTGGGFYTEGAQDYGLNLHRIDVLSFPRSELEGARIELNHGAQILSTADESNPPSDPQPFTPFNLAAGQTEGDWEFRVGTFIANHSTNRNPTATFAPDLLTMGLVPGNHNVIADWDTRGHVLRQHPQFAPDHTAREIVNAVPNDRLLALDIWLSSPEAATSNNHLPVLRVGLRTDIYGETGLLQFNPPRQIMQGRVAFREFRAWNRTDAEDLFQHVGSPLALAAQARRYTAILEPQVRAGGTIDVRPFVQFWSFPINLTAEPGSFRDDRSDAGTVRIHRVVVTSYDLPSFPADCIASNPD